MSLKGQLAKAKALWNKAKTMKEDFDSPVTDGVYVGKLVSAELGESQSSGRLQVTWKAKISGGEFKGENVTWWSGLKTEQNYMYLRRDIARLGKEVPEDINDLEDVLAEIGKEQPMIRFRIKTDGEFQNVRLLKKMNADESIEDEDVTGSSEEAPEDVDVEPEVEEKPTKAKAKAKVEPEPEVEEEEEEIEVEEEVVVEDEQPTLDVGVRVAFDFKGEEIVGEVVEVDNDTEIAKIKSDDGKKYKGIKFDKLRPAPKTKVKKK